MKINVFDEGRLQRRGPDASSEKTVDLTATTRAQFCGCTLHFQGSFTPQPLCDSHGNILLWNGEIFGGLQVPDDENDGEALLNHLSSCDTHSELLYVMLRVQGPWAFIYWQASSKTIWFGRDVLGRRSLLYHLDRSQFALSSVSIGSLSRWTEVPAAGIYYVKIPSDSVDVCVDHIHCYRWAALQDASVPRENIGKLDTATFTRKPTLVSISECHPTNALVWADGMEIVTESIGLVSNLTPFNILTHSAEDSDVESENVIAQFAKCDDKCRVLLDRATRWQMLLAQQLLAVLGEAVRLRVLHQTRNCGRCIRTRKGLNRTNADSALSTHNSCNGLQGKACDISTTHSDVRHQGKDCVSIVRTKNGCDKSGITDNTATVGSVQHHANQQTSGHSDRTDDSARCHPKKQTCGHARVAVLFSGGIDSLIIAALSHRYIPLDESIDLLNVAFEIKPKVGDNDAKDISVSSPRFDVPDRITGHRGLAQLDQSRKWNFVEINVTLEELQQCRRDHVDELVRPHNTVLDDSIGCAIWFAARGRGVLYPGQTECTSTARVLLVGMGADEQLAGYSRHRTRFKSGGWPVVAHELAMEMSRISSRNLGRDDRVISDHGREARFPFLDENVVSFLNSLQVNEKANLHLDRGIGDKLLLRLVAHLLSLHKGATVPKRAIQFGSRIAGLGERKKKAANICDRLAAL